MSDIFLGSVTESDVLVSSFQPEFVNIPCEAFYRFSIGMESNLMVLYWLNILCKLVWTCHWKLPCLHFCQFYAVINADVVHMPTVIVGTTELVTSCPVSILMIRAYRILIWHLCNVGVKNWFLFRKKIKVHILQINVLL